MSIDIFESAEALLQLDPVRTYPQRAISQLAQTIRVSQYRFILEDGTVAAESEPAPASVTPGLSIPVRTGKEAYGTLHFYSVTEDQLGPERMRIVRWATRMLARGMDYSKRLANEGARRSGEKVQETLARAPLTPRERDVVALLVTGSSTRDIASRTGLTIATVNTYLKRIFSKLGVHSRVELVARMAGTDAGEHVKQVNQRLGDGNDVVA